MRHISFVPYIEDFVNKYFHDDADKKALEKFILKLKKLPKKPIQNLLKLFNPEPQILKALILKPFGDVPPKFVNDAKENKKRNFKKKEADINKFSRDDKDVFSFKYENFSSIITDSSLKAETPKRFAIRFQREFTPSTYGELELVPDVWIGDKTKTSLKEKASKFDKNKEKNYSESLKHFDYPQKFQKNKGVCFPLNPSDKIVDNKPKIYFDDWLNYFFTDGETVYLHVIYNDDLLSVVFSNVDTIVLKGGFGYLVDKYIPNISKKLRNDYIKTLEDNFPPYSYFDQGQACCPPAE